MTVVLDASAALALCLEDEVGDRIDRGLRRLGDPVVPSIWLSEVVQGVLAAERRGRLTPEAAVRAIGLLEDLRVRVEIPTVVRNFTAVMSMARLYQLTAYDASYLELALREGLPLATLDRALERAARQAGVELLG